MSSLTTGSLEKSDSNRHFIDSFVDLVLEVDSNYSLAKKIKLTMGRDNIDVNDFRLFIERSFKTLASALAEEENASAFLQTSSALLDVPQKITSRIMASDLLERSIQRTDTVSKSSLQIQFGIENRSDTYKHLKRQLSHRPSFKSFVHDLHDFVNPGWPHRVRRLLDLHYTLNDKSIPSIIQSVVSELLYAHPTELDITRTSVGCIDRAKTLIEQTSGRKWNWWPLADPWKSLDHDEVRIIWRCVSISLRLG